MHVHTCNVRVCNILHLHSASVTNIAELSFIKALALLRDVKLRCFHMNYIQTYKGMWTLWILVIMNMHRSFLFAAYGFFLLYLSFWIFRLFGCVSCRLLWYDVVLTTVQCTYTYIINKRTNVVLIICMYIYIYIFILKNLCKKCVWA